MEKKRPLGVTFLAILAGFAAFFAIIHTLQMLHLFPIRGPFGQFTFFTFSLFGAIMWGIVAAVWIWLVRKLWNVEPDAWWFIIIFTILTLVLNFVSLLGGTPWEALATSTVLNALILVYALIPGTRDAFGTQADQISAPPTEEMEG